MVCIKIQHLFRMKYFLNLKWWGKSNNNAPFDLSIPFISILEETCIACWVRKLMPIYTLYICIMAADTIHPIIFAHRCVVLCFSVLILWFIWDSCGWFTHIKAASLAHCLLCAWRYVLDYIDGLVQERRNSSALAMELRLSCTNPSIWTCYSCTLYSTHSWLQRYISLALFHWPDCWGWQSFWHSSA